jgi:FkbH-like protein
VLDYERLCAHAGYRSWQDDKTWYLGRAPLSTQALSALARVQTAFIQASLGRQRKCLVLDLDNTLWGGVVGEDGVEGIRLGHTYPGNAFRHFQGVVLQLQRRGVLLALNSKNNQADVEEVLRSHPDMILREGHFASARINWRAKPENMVEIANDLGIGLDSLVFFDDSPAERALMRQALPEVLTLEVPSDPLKYAEVLLESRAFDRLSFTREDRRRGEMYREQAARRELKQAATSPQDFLRRLKMEVSIRPVDQFAFPRVLDLIHKTNQFNLTTRRHSAGRLAEMIADPTCGAFYLRVADRFGDNGIVGAAILQLRNGAAYIDTFLLSCRVIGRTVETAFLSFLTNLAKARGATTLEGEFIPTAKNAPAAEFFARHGFKRAGGDGAGSRWRLNLSDVSFQCPSYIRVADEIGGGKL